MLSSKKYYQKKLIFIKKNYNFDNKKIADALSNRYCEHNNKEFICNSCHKKLNEGTFDLEHGDQAQLNVPQSNISHEPASHCNLLNFTQNPKCTIKCMCTCCHRCDIVWSQCVIFKESHYDVQNYTVKEALQRRIHVVTTNEFKCKKCDKALKTGNMPINVAANENIKCFCDNVPTDTFHMFNKTEYNNNPFMEQIEHNQQTIGNNPIICNKCNDSFIVNLSSTVSYLTMNSREN